MTSNRGGSLAAAGAGRAAGGCAVRGRGAAWPSCAAYKAITGAVISLNSPTNSFHTGSFASILHWLSLKPAAYCGSWTTRSASIFCSISLSPHLLSVGPTVLLTAAPYRACVRSRSRGSLRYTASRPHYYRPVPPRLLRPYRMARLGQNLAHSGFVESCRIPNRPDCTFRARYVKYPRFLLQVERKIVELLNGAKRRDKLKLP